MSSLKINVVNKEGRVPVTVFQLIGQVDANTYTSLQDKAEEENKEGADYMLLDMTEVGYMSSAGFKAMHSIYSMLGGIQDGGKSQHLGLLNPTDEVSRIVKTLGFDSYINIYSNMDEAIAAF